MQCPNCGAEIEKTAGQCRYCGRENPQIAEAEQRAQIESIYQRAADLLHLPERIVRKVVKYIIIAAAVILTAFLIFLLAMWLTADARQEMSYQKQQNQIAQLEEYYQNGEYNEMLNYIEKNKIDYAAAFRKYQFIGKIYQKLVSYTEWADNYLSSPLNYLSADMLAMHIDNFEIIIRNTNELEQDGFLYGEKAEAEALREEAAAYLRDRLHLTDDEILQAAEWKYDSREMAALGETCLLRLLEAAD